MNWLRRNFLSIVVPSIGLFLLAIYLLFGGRSVDPSIPGGGFWTLIASGLLFFGAHKAGSNTLGGKIIGAIAIILLIIWAWPRIFPFLDNWGFAPNLILILAILAAIWMWKGGKGFLGWRMWLFLFLVLCWLGARGEILKDSFNAFLSATGIEFKMPDIKMPQFVKNTTDGTSSYLNNISAQKASQVKERVVKNGSTFYKYDGANFTKKDVSANEEFIKVFLLGESVQKDGLTFEKVRIGDPATGEDAWVYSGILLSSPTAKDPEKSGSNSAEKKDPQWEEVEKKVVDFSQVKIVKIAHQQHVAEMILPLNLENGIYRITLNGSYNFRLGGQWYEVAWEGNDRLFAFPDRKPAKDLPCGAVVIFNRGDNITPTTKDGIQINDKLLNPAIQINAYFKDPNEYYSAETRGMILKNSPTNPLTIKIEKEVKS